MSFISQWLEFLVSYGVDMYHLIAILLISFNMDLYLFTTAKILGRNSILASNRDSKRTGNNIQPVPGIDLCIFQGIILSLAGYVVRCLVMLSIPIAVHLSGGDTSFLFIHTVFYAVVTLGWTFVFGDKYLSSNDLGERDVEWMKYLGLTLVWLVPCLMIIATEAHSFKSAAELRLLNNNRMQLNEGELDISLKGSLLTEDKNSVWLLSSVDSKPTNWPDNEIWGGFLVVPSNDISSHFLMEGIKQIIYSRDPIKLARIRFDEEMKVRSITMVEYSFSYKIIDLYYQPVLVTKELKRWDFEKNQILTLD